MSSHTDTTAIPDDESNAPTQYVPKAKYDALLAENQQLREALSAADDLAIHAPNNHAAARYKETYYRARGGGGEMSSHADTIRSIRFRADLVRRAGFEFYQAPQVAQDALAGLAGEMDKWADALDALLAENQQLREALLGVQLTEINGRLCARPEAPDPWFANPDTPRESRCCPACRELWAKIDAALAAVGEE